VNRPFQFNKRSQLFIGRQNEAPTVAAMRVYNPDLFALRDPRLRLSAMIVASASAQCSSTSYTNIRRYPTDKKLDNFVCFYEDYATQIGDVVLRKV
jgi:hypothetical protein